MEWKEEIIAIEKLSEACKKIGDNEVPGSDGIPKWAVKAAI